MKALLIIILMSSQLLGCNASKATVECQENILKVDNKELEIQKISAEKSGDKFNIGLSFEGKMLQLEYSENESAAHLIDFKSAPYSSKTKLKVEFSEVEQLISMKASGLIEKDSLKHKFEFCVKDIRYETQNHITE